MPELVTHAVAGYILKTRNRLNLWPVLLIGAILPDVLTRIPNAVFNFLHIRGGEEWTRPLHSPFVLLLVVCLLTLCFEEKIRSRVFANLAAGAASHLFLDFLQMRGFEYGFERVYERGYLWLYPVSRFDFQIGLFGPEASVPFLPVTISVFVFLWWHKNRNESV